MSFDPGTDPSLPRAEGTGRPSAKLRRRGLALAGGALACAGAAVLWLNGRPDPVLPTPDWDALPVTAPEVAHAIAEARELVDRQPESSEAWGQLGMVLLAHDLHAAAEPCFARAEKIDPREYLWPYLHGVSVGVRDPERAFASLARAAACGPRQAHVRLRLADMLLARGQMDEAQRHIDTVLATDPDNPRAALAMARLVYGRGDAAAARGWAERSRSQAPRQRATLELLAQLYFRLGQHEAADEVVEELRLIPEGPTNWDDPAVALVLSQRCDADWQVLYARSLSEAGELKQAAVILETIVAGHPERADIHAELGRLYEVAGEHERAAAALDAALLLHPTTAELHRLRGVVLVATGDLSGARENFERAIQLKPDHGLAWENLGDCLRWLGDQDDAMRAYERAVRLRPNSPAAHAGLGRTLLDAGRAIDAAGPLETAVRLAPEKTAWAEWLEAARQGLP